MAITTLGAALIGGGLLGSAALSSNASKNAGKTVAQSTDRAADLQNEQFNKLLALQMPGYNRAEQAAGIYGQALGFPSMTGGGSASPAATPAYTSGGAPVAAQAGPQRLMTADKPGAPMQTMEGNERYYGQPMQSYTSAPSQVTTGAGNAPPPAQVPATGGQAPLDIAGQVFQTPGYQTQLDQGLKAIDRAAPLTGGMYSGRRMKALNDYGQQTFGSYYNDWLNRVGGMAGQAPQIAQNIGQAGMQNANNVGQLWMTGANAKAQGSLNSANAWTSAIGTGVGMFGGAKGWI